MLTGRVDDLQNNKVFGWAFNSEQPDEHLVIRVMHGPQVIASGVANVMRKDLPDAGVGKGDHAFEILVPPNIESFQGLMIIAQSSKSGEIALPIASNVDRKLDTLFSAFSSQVEEALFLLKEEIDTIKERGGTQGGGETAIPEDLAKRLVALEQRMDAAEVFFIRIDETVRQIAEERKKPKRKRFLGIF